MHSTFLRYISHKCCVVTSGPDRRTDLDLEREGDLDPERLEARDGLTEPERLSDLTWAGLPRSDLDGERESWCHTRMLKQLYSGRALTDTHARTQTNKHSKSHSHTLTVHCKCCGEKC